MIVCLLCIGFFQKSTPELIFSERLGKNQLIFACGEAVIDKHVSPFAIPPELRSIEQNIFKLWKLDETQDLQLMSIFLRAKTHR